MATADDRTPSNAPPSAGRTERRRILVDRPFQLRAAAGATAFAALLVIPANLLLHTIRNTQSAVLAGGTPETEAVFRAADIRSALVVGGASLALLLFIFVATVLATHRTAGAIVAVSRTCAKISNGDLTAHLSLRATDNLTTLQTPFNDMVDSLRRRARVDADELDSVATDIESATTPEELASTAERLRTLAQMLRVSIYQSAPSEASVSDQASQEEETATQEVES